MAKGKGNPPKKKKKDVGRGASPRPTARPSVATELRRASSRTILIFVGSAELSIGVAVYLGAGFLIARLIDWFGHDLSVWDRRVVLFLQLAASVGFLVQGLITVFAGIVLALRGARDDLREGDS